MSEVANAWLTLIADRQLLALARETHDSQRKSYDLTKLRFDSGVSSEIDLHRSETSWREAEVDIAQQTRRVAQDRNALVLLVGEPLPSEIADGARPFEAQTFAKTLPAGLPAELLVRRPDVRAAEHALKAANADIGAARAAFFPSIELTGFYGQASNDLSALFQSGQSAWSFTPQVHLPIFSGGANLAGLDLANVRKRIEIAHYEQSIQIAFREVADALVTRATLDDQLRAQEALTRASDLELQARRHALSRRRGQLSERADRATRFLHRAAPAHRDAARGCGESGAALYHPGWRVEGVGSGGRVGGAPAIAPAEGLARFSPGPSLD